MAGGSCIASLSVVPATKLIHVRNCLGEFPGMQESILTAKREKLCASSDAPPFKYAILPIHFFSFLLDSAFLHVAYIGTRSTVGLYYEGRGKVVPI